MSDDMSMGHGGAPLEGTSIDYLETDGPDLLARWDRHQAFWDGRLAAGLDSTGRILMERAGPECKVFTRGQEQLSGVNFASQDYLSLSSHPVIQHAAVEAISRWGLSSASPTSTQGSSLPSLALEERIADVLCCRDAMVFPSGWAAAYGAIHALVRKSDHILIDCLSHPSLRESAASATPNLHYIPNRSHEVVGETVAKIRASNSRAGILVVTETLFPTNSTVPDLRTLRTVCLEGGATLVVSVAQDFGAVGNGGLGFLGEQAMIGQVDIVLGSFSKTFASNGGFVAFKSPALKQALRLFAGPLAHSSALSPVQASIALAALDLVLSAEGAHRRRRLMTNVMRLREGLAARAFNVMGQPSATVSVSLGGIAEALLTTRAALNRGALVNLVEHPEVSRNDSRWLLHVAADHTTQQVDRLVQIAVDAREEASRKAS